MATAFSPSRHIGIQANYTIPVVWATAGVFFQPVEDAEVRANVEDNNKDYGRGPGHTFTGKVVVRPLYKMEDASLHIGFAASYRTPKADMSPSKWGAVRISSRNATNINRKKYLDTGNIADVNHEVMMTAELAGHWKGLRWEAAYLADNIHIHNGTTKHFYGIYAQAGYLLFGGRQNYDAGGAKYTRITPGRDWGDMELCARFDRLDLDSQGIYGGAANAWTAGLNYYVNPNIKMMLNYQYVTNNKYANGNGKLIVGHNAAGEPTTNPDDVDSSMGSVGVGYNMLSCRFEVNF
jgi:phosphate-selective porin OprO/OprP